MNNLFSSKDIPKMERLVKSGKMSKKLNKDGSCEYYDPKVYSIKNGKYIKK